VTAPTCRVIVLAKAPLPGRAKTRLMPALGPAGAARLAARLLQHALQQALAAGLGQVELCGDPHGADPAFGAAATDGRLLHSAQGEGDLGQRMARALDRALHSAAPGGARALLIGTDAPGLDAAYLRQAALALDTADAVFGPAADGGYALVGLRRPLPRLFEAMPWSTAQVMATSRLRLAETGASHAELPLLHDIDEPADLVHLPPTWLSGSRPTDD
jgi:uncharacterized protein